MNRPQTAGSPPPPGDNYKWQALGVVMVGTFMAILDNSIVNVALPHMMSSFGTDLERIKWVATAYMIAYGVVVLSSDFLSKRFGQERVYVSALGLFTLGSFLCGRAWDINSMIIFRAFQAVGGGLMLPTGMTIITQAFKPQERGSAFGMFGMVILLAPVLGPTLGGYLVEKINWPSIFLINIPIGIGGILIAMSIFNFSPHGESRPFDWIGFSGLGTALTTLLLALSQGESWGWSSPPTVLCFSLAALGFFIFIVNDLYFANPIIDLSLFGNIPFTLLCIISFLRAVVLFGRTLFLSLFMQTLMGYSAMAAGFYLIPGAIVAGIFTPIFGKLSDKTGMKILSIPGFLLVAWSCWLYRDLSVNSPYAIIFWPMVIMGIGMAALSSPMMSAAMNVVEQKQIGMVSILQTVLMQVGGAYGINYLETVVDARKTYHLQSMMEGFTRSFHNVSGNWVAKMGGAVSLNNPQLLKQAYLSAYAQKMAGAWAYNDAFIIMTVLSLLCMGLLCFFKEPSAHSDSPGHSVEAG